MSKSEHIRSLGRSGRSTKEISEAVNVSYQYAYNVLRQAGLLTSGSARSVPARARIELRVDTLLAAGFQSVGSWQLDQQGVLGRPAGIPKSAGVYAFAINGLVQYVGVAKTSLYQRIYFYSNPGIGQKTNIRLRELINLACLDGKVDVLVAQPNDFDWNGLPVSGCAGLEIGLISAFSPPWNVQGALGQ